MSVTFPNVPFVQGVPPILRNATANYDAQSLISATDDTTPTTSNDWGIFDVGGSCVLSPDSFVAFEASSEYRIADYPVEKGGFQSYNKVAMPFEVRLTLSKGGSVADRQSFINDLETLQASLDVYDVATPEHVYVGVNITRVSQARTAQAGAGMATVEVVLQEVRQTVTVAYTTATTDAPPALANQSATTSTAKPTSSLANGTTNSPTAVAPVNQGGVQPKAVSISGAKLVTSTSGKQLYVYNQPIGAVR